MSNLKVIRLSKSTKILFSLFNFFAPVSLMYMIISVLGAFNIFGALFSLLSIFTGLFCLIFNILKYNRFLRITDEAIFICKGNLKHPQVIKMININDILPKEINADLSIQCKSQRIKLLHTSCSIIGIFCYIGPFAILPVLKNRNVALHKLGELYQIFPELFTQAPKLPSKGEDIFLDIIIWCFVLFISIIGCFGILITPFIPFLG